jgi:hypothetical protein
MKTVITELIRPEFPWPVSELKPRARRLLTQDLLLVLTDARARSNWLMSVAYHTRSLVGIPMPALWTLPVQRTVLTNGPAGLHDAQLSGLALDVLGLLEMTDLTAGHFKAS